MTAPAGRAGRVLEPVPEDVYGSWSPAPCPDGLRVAFVSDRGGEPQVWLTAGQQGWVPLRALLSRVLRVTWSPTGAWLACEVAGLRASRSELWLVRPDGRDLHQVAGSERSTAVLAGGPWSGWTADGHLLATETGADGTGLALRIDPDGGARRVLAQGPLLTLLDVDRSGSRALLRRGPRGRRRLSVVELDDGGETELGPSGPGQSDIGVFSRDGTTVYCRSDADREFAALLAVPAGGGTPEVLSARDGAELQDLTLSPEGDRLVLLWNVDGGRSAVTTLDVTTGREQEVRRLPREVLHECRMTADGSRLLFTAEGWADARGVWSLHLTSGAAFPVSSSGSGPLRSSRGASIPSVDVADLVAPELLGLRSADGLALSGWLYAPAGPPPWPTVLHLHGGPEAQERPVYNSLFQSLVAAGVAVFAPNVRGSSGFGRRFLHADDLELRFGAIADVGACAAHLLAEGLVEPGRLGCSGRSYGGWLTLAALVEFPEHFAVGVDVCGMSDFASFYAGTEPWIASAAVGKYGHPDRDRELLRALSPLHRLDRVRAPLLVVHGSGDTNVPVQQAEQVVAALAARGAPHRYLLFEGEGHELLDSGNRVRFVRETVAWVVEHLAPLSGTEGASSSQKRLPRLR